MTIYQWIDKHLEDIGKRLPDAVDQNPSSFSCGYIFGRKQILLELERFLISKEEE